MSYKKLPVITCHNAPNVIFKVKVISADCTMYVISRSLHLRSHILLDYKQDLPYCTIHYFLFSYWKKQNLTPICNLARRSRIRNIKEEYKGDRLWWWFVGPSCTKLIFMWLCCWNSSSCSLCPFVLKLSLRNLCSCTVACWQWSPVLLRFLQFYVFKVCGFPRVL